MVLTDHRGGGGGGGGGRGRDIDPPRGAGTISNYDQRIHHLRIAIIVVMAAAAAWRGIPSTRWRWGRRVMQKYRRIVRFLLGPVRILRAHAFHVVRRRVTLLELLLRTFHGARMPRYILLVVREEATGTEEVGWPHIVRAPRAVSRG